MCCLHDLETLRVGEVVRERKLERHVANTGAAAEATATKWPRQLTLQDKLASWPKCRDSNAEIQKHITRWSELNYLPADQGGLVMCAGFDTQLALWGRGH